MTPMTVLRREASAVTTARGHRMTFTEKSDTVWIGRCIRCQAELVLNTHPQPNEIDISGEAVALNCRGRIR